MVVNYHLFHVNTGTIAGAATATVLNKGRLVGARICVALLGAAGSPGYINISLEHNNTAQANADTNNPPRITVLATHLVASTVSTGTSVNSGFIPLDRSLQVGDLISASQVQTGTAPTNVRVSIDRKSVV